ADGTLSLSTLTPAQATLVQGDLGIGTTIRFASGLAGQTLTLTGGELAINKDLAIIGPGANQLTVSGNNASRVFDVQAGTVTISGLAITRGNVSGGNGAGIFSNGILSLTGDTISDNAVSGLGMGGGVYNGFLGTLRVINSTVSGNRATQGGGIDNDG